MIRSLASLWPAAQWRGLWTSGLVAETSKVAAADASHRLSRPELRRCSGTGCGASLAKSGCSGSLGESVAESLGESSRGSLRMGPLVSSTSSLNMMRHPRRVVSCKGEGKVTSIRLSVHLSVCPSVNEYRTIARYINPHPAACKLCGCDNDNDDNNKTNYDNDNNNSNKV